MTRNRIFPVRMDRDTIKKIKTLALHQDKSVSMIIRDMVLEFIVSHESPNTNPTL